MSSAAARVERMVYGGLGLLRPTGEESALFVPFALPGELVEVAASRTENEGSLLRIVEPSAERVEPGCPHFGACGGCQMQMASYAEQLRIKAEVLRESLQRAGVDEQPQITTHAAEPWHYRNRIRLHVTRDADGLRLGYRSRGGDRIVPIATCPIAAPLLWNAAERLIALSSSNSAVQRWLHWAQEIEFFCDAEMARLQVTLFSSNGAPPHASDLEPACIVFSKALPELTGVGAVRIHPRTGQVKEQIANWGAPGLNYNVAAERFWVARGGFFQINRFLLPKMVELVCADRSGASVWDLYAGVGLFARFLARRFANVTAVEANPTAARELAAALGRIAPAHRGVSAVIVEFLRQAVLQRERPELVVLDPPRAGAGVEVCSLLARIAPTEILYVSCDPVTLARDLAVLQDDYFLRELHLVDLFPQTYHQEAVVKLRRRS